MDKLKIKKLKNLNFQETKSLKIKKNKKCSSIKKLKNLQNLKKFKNQINLKINT